MFSNKKSTALAAGILLSLNSYAQDQLGLSPITIFASRFEEKLSDALPQTTVITSDEIQKSGASNVSEVLSKVAGLPTRINLDGSTNAVIDMRGYGDTADNNVVVLLDGIRLSENEQTSARTSMIPLEAIDHIEITKGGNSVLYGDGATSGTINIVSKKKTGNLTIATAGIASYSGYQSSLYHSRQIGNNDISVFAKQYASDNYRQNSKGTEQSAGFNWVNHLDGQTNIGARFFASQEKNKLPGSLPLAYLNSSPRNSEVPGYNWDANVNSASITLFGKKKIENLEMSIDINQRIRSNKDNYSYDAQTVYSGYTTPGWTQSYGNSNTLTNNQSASPNVKINDFLFKKNSLQIGYDWVETRKSGSADKSSSSTPNKIEYNYYDSSYRTNGLYFRDTFYLSNTDKVTLGYRKQTYSQTKNPYFYDSINMTPYNSPWSAQGKQTANEIQYTKIFNSEFSGYIRTSQNFRNPNIDDLTSAGNYDASWNPLINPQISHDIDLGLNYRSSNSVTELTYFHSNIRNEIGYDPSASGGYGGNVNYDPTKREGVVIKQNINIFKQFVILANLQYTSAKFSSGTYSGNALPNVAPYSGNISFGYKMTPQQQFLLTSRFSNQKYMSGDFSNNQPKLPGYVVEDLTYFYRGKSWSFNAVLNNIFNKQYTDTGIYKSSYTDPYKLTVYPNQGRSFSLTGRYNF